MNKSYEHLLREGRIRSHRPRREELAQVLGIVQRDLDDAGLPGLSPDRRFATAYNAILQAARALMLSEGYRSHGMGHHATTFDFLAEALGEEYTELVNYFDDCRRKRNLADYTGVGYVSETEADELLVEAKAFGRFAHEWIESNHPELMEQ
jgi:uncharacterized protein (UPF0332 family)